MLNSIHRQNFAWGQSSRDQCGLPYGRRLQDSVEPIDRRTLGTKRLA